VEVKKEKEITTGQRGWEGGRNCRIGGNQKEESKKQAKIQQNNGAEAAQKKGGPSRSTYQRGWAAK